MFSKCTTPLLYGIGTDTIPMEKSTIPRQPGQCSKTLKLWDGLPYVSWDRIEKLWSNSNSLHSIRFSDILLFTPCHAFCHDEASDARGV